MYRVYQYFRLNLMMKAKFRETKALALPTQTLCFTTKTHENKLACGVVSRWTNQS